MESTLLFGVAALCLIYAGWFRRDFLSPFSVYLFTQSLTLGIAYLKLHKAMTDLQATTWLFLFGGIAAWGAGAYCYSVLSGTPAQFPKPQIWSPRAVRIHFRWALGIYAFFFAGIAILFFHVGEFTIFSKKIQFYMGQGFQIPYLPYLYASSPLATAFMGSLCFEKVNPSKILRILARILTFSIITLALLMVPNRGSLFMNLGVLFILYNYLHRRVPIWFYVASLFLVAAMFVGIGIARKQYELSGSGDIAKTITQLPYIYVANNYWNLDYAINPSTTREIHPFTWGLDAFKGPSELLLIHGTLQHAFGWDNIYSHSIQKVPGFNTTHWLWQAYKDFHLPGVILLPFFLGVLMQWMYTKMRNTWHPRWITLYALCLYMTAWLFFTESYKSGLLWIWVGFILLATRYKGASSTIAAAESANTAKDSLL